MEQKVYEKILRQISEGRKQYWILLDPDDFSPEEATNVCVEAESIGVHAILVGGSLMHSTHLDTFIASIKQRASLPVILFPGDASQISSFADAILFMSLISGRNPDFLISQQVKGAIQIRRSRIEPISMGYMLVESGTVTTVEFMSGTRPIPREKPDISAAHALAGQYLGMKMLYLEAGSGARNSVPASHIVAVKQATDIPLIVGGGIRDGETAREKLCAGADIIVTGNMLSLPDGRQRMKDISSEVASFSSERIS